MGYLSVDKKFIITEKALMVLNEVYNNPGIKISEVGKKLGFAKSTTTTILKHLKDMGLIEIKTDEEIKDVCRKGVSIKVKRKVKRVYPKVINCTEFGSVIVPVLYSLDGSKYMVGIMVLKCPFINECKERKAMVPGKCKLYDMLSDRDKKEIKDLLEKLKRLLQ